MKPPCNDGPRDWHNNRKIPKITPGAYIFQRPVLWGLFLEGLIFGGTYFWRGFSTEGNLCFKIDWPSLIVGGIFTVFALFYFVFEGNFPSTSPREAYIWRGDLTEVFLCYRFMLYRGSLPYFLLLLGLRISFVIPRTSIVICGLLYRGSPVVSSEYRSIH